MLYPVGLEQSRMPLLSTENSVDSQLLHLYQQFIVRYKFLHSVRDVTSYALQKKTILKYLINFAV